MTAVNGVLQEHKFKLSDGQLNHALQMAIFPSIFSTIMPLVHQQNADMDALILRTAATIKGNQLPALDYLKVGPKLLHLLLQGVSNAGIFSSAQSPAADAGSGDMTFDVPADCMRLPFWPVYRMLYTLCETPTPMKKLVIVNTAISLISSCVSLYSANAITLNGDDLLPILTYCVAMSGLQHPLAEMNFVAEFVTMGEPTSEQMFCLNQFEIALALMQQLQRDLPDIASHVISEGDIASALALAASSRPEDDDDDDSEEEVRCLKLPLLLLLPNVRLHSSSDGTFAERGSCGFAVFESIPGQRRTVRCAAQLQQHLQPCIPAEEAAAFGCGSTISATQAGRAMPNVMTTKT
jgi:hypothetical protein